MGSPAGDQGTGKRPGGLPAGAGVDRRSALPDTDPHATRDESTTDGPDQPSARPPGRRTCPVAPRPPHDGGVTGRAHPGAMKNSLLALPLVLLVAACNSTSTGRVAGSQQTAGFPAPDKEVVFDVAVRTLRQQGWSIDVEA